MQQSQVNTLLIQNICRFRVLYNWTIWNYRISNHTTAYQLFRFPEYDDPTGYNITWFEIQNPKQSGYIRLNTGGQYYDYLELHMRPDFGQEFEFEIVICGYEYDAPN